MSGGANEKCLTGKMSAKVVSQPGASSNGMKTSETNSSGSIEALTTAGDASALGMTVTMAKPRAQKVAAPTIRVTMKAGMVLVGTSTPIEQCSRRRDDDHQQDSNNNGVPDPSQQQRPAWERRAPDALEQSPVSGEGDSYRYVGVAGPYYCQGDDGGNVEGGRADRTAWKVRLFIAEQQVEDHEEHQGEDDREEGCHWIPPEGSVLVLDLPESEQEPVHASSPSFA